MTKEQLTVEHHMAFEFTWSGQEKAIIVAKPTSESKDSFLLHFTYGHHSLGEWVKKDDILAVGAPDGHFGIRGWGGFFEIIKPTLFLYENLKPMSAAAKLAFHGRFGALQ